MKLIFFESLANSFAHLSVSHVDIPFTAINGVSVIVCLVAAIFVFWLGLYKKLVYRMSLYQVLASLAFAIVETLQIVFINYGKNPQVYGRLCTAVGWFVLYCFWVKLLFTMWVTFHLFCFAVFQKNLIKFEVLYTVTSLLVPSVIAIVPLTTNTYRLSPSHSYCYIYNSSNNYNIQLYERLALWDLPALVILIAASSAMVVVVIKLTYRVCWRFRYEPITDRDQFQEALKQLLPLAAFPILFFIFIMPQFAFHITMDKTSTPNETLHMSALILVALWSLASGVTLIIHLVLSNLCARMQRNREKLHSSTKATIANNTITYANSRSSFVLANSI